MSAITNGIECVQPRKDVGFNGFVVEDVIGMGYWFWIDTDNTVCVTCRLDIEFDIFTTADTSIDDVWLYLALNTVMKRALKDAGLVDKITWFDFDF